VLLNDGNIDSLYKYRVYKYNRGFFEVINKINSHKFSDEGNKYIGFYTYNTINYTQEQLNELANAIKNKGAKVFFATRTNNQTFANQLTLQTGGKYEYFNDFNTDITTFADYIKSQEGDKSTNDKTVYIKKGETIDYTKYFADYEGDSQYLSSGEKWLYIHNPNYFTNNDGFAPFHNKELTAPIKQFNHVGEYFITYKAKDNPKNDNRFDIYRKWSEAKTLKIIVHEGELSIPPEDKIAPLQINIDVSGDLREYHRVDFKINVIKGSKDIDWNSLDISFNTSDYLPFSKPNTLEFSKVFSNEGTKTIIVRLSDVNGNTITETKIFNISDNLSPIANMNIIGDGYRNELGTAKFNLENLSNPTDDTIGTVEYYIESTKYVDNGDGNYIPNGTEWYLIEPNEYGEIELDKIGLNKIKQVVTETYVNGIGLNGEDLDKYRVFKSSEIIKTVNVLNEAPQVEYVVTPNIIKVGDNIEHITNIIDDTPSGEYAEYMFIHDDTYFQNSQGKHDNHNIIINEPTEILDKKGLYDFYVRAIDEDGASTDWVHGGQVIAVSKPVADFELTSLGNEIVNDVFRKGSAVTIENRAYNEDYETTVANHGIEYIKIEYKNVGDDSYITIFEGDNMPNYIPTFNIPQINERGIYEVKMTVRSPEGIESICIKQFTVLDLRLDAEIEPSTIYASETYIIRAILSEDGLGAVAYIPYSDTWVTLDKVNEDSNNKYYEKEITTDVTLADGTYNIEVYGMYPYNKETKQILPLTVHTPVELKSDIKPIGPTEYIQIIQDNDGNNDYISVPAGEKIKITAEVISPVTAEYVKAQLEGEVNLSYNSILNIYEGEINIPGTKLDKDYYNLNIETSLPNGNIAINHHKVKINTPINLLPNIPRELISDTTVAIKAETSKYVETLTVTLYKGESFEKILSMTVDRIIGNKKEWIANYDVPVGLPEGTYIAEFRAETYNGNVEVDNETFILQSLDLIDLRITNIINHLSYETKYPILYNDPIVPVGYKTGYYITFKINAKGSPDSVKMKITYKGYNKEFEVTKESQNGNDSVWKLEWYADPFTPFGTIINAEVIAQKGETILNFNNKYGWNGDYLKVIGTIEQDWRIDQEF
jgi:hypothetical protein